MGSGESAGTRLSPEKSSNNSHDLQRLSEGELVSGPSAYEYRARLEATARFEGRVVQTVRHAGRLAGTPRRSSTGKLSATKTLTRVVTELSL